MPKVSVVIGAYNAEKYIAETLESVLTQTVTDYEIIVVDDGSTDHTATVVEEYVKKHPGFKFFRKTNGGSSTARNYGLKAAEGEWIAFLDADDLWSTDKLEKQLEYAASHPGVDLVFTNAAIFGERKKAELYVRPDERHIKQNDMFQRLLLRNFVPFSSILVRKKAVEALGNFDEKILGSEDHDLLLRMAQNFKLAYLDGAYVRYRVSENNKSSNQERRFRTTLALAEKHFDPRLMSSYTFRLAWHNRLASLHYYLGYVLFEKNNFDLARQELRTAIKHNPFLNLKQYTLFLSTFLSRSIIEGLRQFKRHLKWNF